jgi:hypothetical protein
LDTAIKLSTAFLGVMLYVYKEPPRISYLQLLNPKQLPVCHNLGGQSQCHILQRGKAKLNQIKTPQPNESQLQLWLLIRALILNLKTGRSYKCHNLKTSTIDITFEFQYFGYNFEKHLMMCFFSFKESNRTNSIKITDNLSAVV